MAAGRARASGSDPGKGPSNRPPPPIVVIYGPDVFLRAVALEDVLQSVLGKDRDQMTLAEFSGPDATIATVLDECRTPSLLAPVRLVLVRDADDFVSANRDVIEKYLSAPSPSGVLVLDCQSWPKNTRLYRLTAEIGKNIPCETPKGAAVVGWLTDRANDPYGCRLENAAARLLVDLVGAQLGLLDMELSKLATFVAPETQIRAKDVEQLVGESRAEVVFKLVDAICDGNARAALELWDQVISHDRDAEYRAIGGLAYSFRRMAEARRVVESGAPIAVAAKEAGIWGDLQAVRRQLGRFSAAQWEDILSQLLRIDVGMKSSLGGIKLGVEKLICSLAAAS